MLKKVSAYSFILVANLILWIHGVVPHHHHHEIVCFIIEHCTSDAPSHEHHPSDHQHEGSNDHSLCGLSEFIAAEPDYSSRSFINLPSGENQLQSGSYTLSDNQSGICANIIKGVAFQPGSPPIFSSIITSVSAFRAPPLV
jgi:hypothetical protein